MNEQPSNVQAHGARTRKRLMFVGVAIALFLVLALMFDRSREKAHRVMCMSNMHAFGLSIAMYSEEHEGRIPRDFGEVRQFYTSDKALTCPSAKDRSRPSYEILLGGKKWNGPDTIDAIVMTESPLNHRSGRNALYGDGHVSWVPVSDN